MRRDLERRSAKLERHSADAFVAKMSALAIKLGDDPETCLRAVRGHEAELEPELGKGGFITFQGFHLLYKLRCVSRDEPPEVE